MFYDKNRRKVDQIICWCGSNRTYRSCHWGEDKKRGVIHPLLVGTIIKTPEQIAGIREAGRVTAAILDKVGEVIREGMTTEEINILVHEETQKYGGIPAPLHYRGFPKSVCTSLNNVICHGIPSRDVRLTSGDIINVDVTTILNGYYADASRMFCIGDVKENARKLVNVAQECLTIAIKLVRPGCKLGDLGYAIQQHAESHGYSVVRVFTGHGIGIRFHEPPEVMHVGKPGEGVVLVPGMVFTIEPMINEGKPDCRILSDGWTAVTCDGLLSAQWEHTVVVTESGVEVLTGKG